MKKFDYARQPFQWVCQIFFENLYPNQRFGVETVIKITVSTNGNHYNYCSYDINFKGVIRNDIN